MNHYRNVKLLNTYKLKVLHLRILTFYIVSYKLGLIRKNFIKSIVLKLFLVQS